MAAGAGFAGTRSLAFVGPAHHTPAVPVRQPAWIAGIRRAAFVQARRTHPRKAQQGDGDEDGGYQEDDQRRFWDTVVKVCVFVFLA